MVYRFDYRQVFASNGRPTGLYFSSSSRSFGRGHRQAIKNARYWYEHQRDSNRPFTMLVSHRDVVLHDGRRRV